MAGDALPRHLPVIFTNPAGAPELACDECGCRWFDRMTNSCYECGAEVSEEARAEFQRALEAFARLPFHIGP